MADARPFITCHVLETTTGTPAQGVNVTLTLLSPTNGPSSTGTFSGTTNTDGRVTSWNIPNDPDNAYSMDLNSAIQHAKRSLADDAATAAAKDDGQQQQLIWSLRFDTGSFYGKGKTFWPEVELRFFTKLTEKHYHVPLLLGPWSYTTYRGS